MSLLVTVLVSPACATRAGVDVCPACVVVGVGVGVLDGGTGLLVGGRVGSLHLAGAREGKNELGVRCASL